MALAAAAVIGCRHKHAPSNAPPAGSDDGAQVPAHWEVIRDTDDAFFVARGSAVALIDRAGTVVSHPAITPERAENAPMERRLLAWVDGANTEVVHLVDLDAGRERWHVSAAHRVDSIVFGTKSIGLLTVEGIELRHERDGSLGFHAPGPKAVGVSYQDGLFVFVDEYGNVTAVDEASDAVRWTFDTKGSRLDSYDVERDGAEVDVNGWRLSVKTGKGHPTPTYPLDPASTETIARASGGGALVADDLGKRERAMYLVADDRIVWRSKEWSRLLDPGLGLHSLAITTPESGAAVLDYQVPPRHVLVGFDNKTGHVRFDRELGRREVLVGGDGDCIGVLQLGGGLGLKCLDALTGKAVWEHPLAGTMARAWHIKRQFLVASGSPATLEALDAKGEVRWSVTLPDTEVRDAATGSGLVAHIDTKDETAWRLLRDVLVLADAEAITTIDLGTGKQTIARP